jgi:hypothetical protein
MNKKGFQVELKNLILGIVIAIILILLFTQVANYLKYTVYWRESCRASVAGAAASESLIPVDCAMQRKEIKFDDVKQGDSVSSALLSQKVADSLYDCWYMFGNGNLKGDPFLKDRTFLDKNTDCVLCAKITFDKDIQKNMPVVRDFNSWAKSTKVQNTGVYYSDYLLSPKVKEKLGSASLDWLPDIVTTSDNYIVFAQMSKGSAERFLSKIPLVGSLLSLDQRYPVLFVLEPQDFNKLNCTRIYN